MPKLRCSWRSSATHDPLTGLANRTALMDRLTVALRRASRTGQSCAIVFLDLDDFKFVNDSLGHADGDVVLKAVADRLRSEMRADECIARIGGDEFVVVLEDLAGAQEAILAANRIAAFLAEPYRVAGVTVMLPASVGVLPDAQRHVDQVEAALRDADFAMYEAKSRVRGGVCVYDPAMHAARDRDDRTETEARGGARRGRAAGRVPAASTAPVTTARSVRRPWCAGGTAISRSLPPTSCRWPSRPGTSCGSVRGCSARRSTDFAAPARTPI